MILNISVGKPLPCDQSESERLVSVDDPATEKREREQEGSGDFSLPQLERKTGGEGGHPTQVWLHWQIQKYNSLTNTNTQVWLSQAQQRLSPPETPGWEECSSPKNETIGSLSLRKFLTNLEMHRLVQNFRYSYFMSEMSWI